jgi:Zn2+/Cd2+-exporting ATPase
MGRENMPQQTYQIGNMDCVNCAREVQTGVGKLKGIEAVTVEFATNTMNVTGDVPFETLKERVEALGKTIELPVAQHNYLIGNMDCVGCAREVQTGVEKLNDVEFVHVDFATNQMQLTGNVDYETLKTRVESLGKTIHLADQPQSEADNKPKRGGVLGFWDYLWERQSTRLAVYGGFTLIIALIAEFVVLAPEGVTILLYLLAMGISLKPIAESGINTLRINHEFNINMLMTIAALGAIILGEYLESATVIFLFAIGEALEGYTADRARDSLRGLVALKPLTANRIVEDKTQVVPVTHLQIDDHIRVLPGEKIPMDGEVLSGSSTVNQASITGESLPVAKTIDDEVFAGAINGEGVLQIRVTRLAKDNTLSRIIDLVQKAQSVRAPSQRLIDQFAHVYTPAVTISALLIALIPPLVFGEPFWDTAIGHGWFYRALSMLVIACPCALVISTPVTVISAITSVARRGVLIKGGAHLEALGRIHAIAFDKTGTLTRGTPTVTETHTNDCADNNPCSPCEELMSLAAAIEVQSTHPYAQAILASAKQQNLVYATASQVETLTGHGVRGTVHDKIVTIGSHRYFENEFDHSQQLCDTAKQIESKGQTAVMLHDGDDVRGVIAIADTVRDESQQVVSDLHHMGIDSMMLTGDNQVVADAIGEQVGVDAVYAELLPQDKVKVIETLQAQYQGVAMIGDGINDTPALATATIGIAMGGAGTAQAMETADIVLMADNLNQLPFTIRMARFARTLIKQNIVLSFGLKAVFLILALTGNITMLVAVFADVGMSLLVTMNGMRALKKSTES